MKRLDPSRLKDSFINVSTFPADLGEGRSAAPAGALLDAVVEAVEKKNGFAVVFGVNKLLADRGLDLHTESGAALARDYLEGIFRAIAPRFDLARYSPTPIAYDRVAKMDVDGFNKNRNFTPNSDHTESREFVTTKCVHFDSATPFIANLYGPNQNISGGMPMICDTRRFCQDKGLDPRSLIENIPNNYNVAVKAEFSEEILRDYSFALKLDLENDIVMIVLHNEVVGGLAHAATQPSLTDASKAAKRPIRHVEFQVAGTDDLRRWYDYYGLSLEKATNHKDDANITRFVSGELNPYPNIIEVRA
ncbi:hypothetical protein D7W82_19620 [Corallococcus sp. CA049B]|uniref:hypothetical protein n=1 Tax=Corallococcus sp. CA049B TaxID=2316730 RepID=UPI000EA3C712|nr:hypothetical protein [Corallococcus sp. CA049B]RKG85411.1 hypothetical protein D7W82_19620 [Corallococcus sp. CA049B]